MTDLEKLKAEMEAKRAAYDAAAASAAARNTYYAALDDAIAAADAYEAAIAAQTKEQTYD